MILSIKLTEEEMKLAESYAKHHSMTLEEAFKGALFEKLEDEYDLIIAESSLTEFAESGENSRAISELWKELDL